jgi:hypothetical protein
VKRTRKYSRHLNISVREKDSEEFDRAYKNTIYRNKSQYARKLLLGKPVTVICRNRSLDDFIEAAVKIRKDLKTILSMEIFTPVEREELKIRVNQILEQLIKIIEQCS